MTAHGLVVDLFAGGGGASAGIEAALGRPVDIAINHDAVALTVHKANHPGTRHLDADIWEVRPKDATGGRPVDLLWASPDCTHFSSAKGDVPKRQDIRSLAWAVVRWAATVRPAVIILENVSEFRTWGPLGPDGRPVKRRMGATFLRWKGRLERLGYRVDFTILDASLYGAPTRRRRLFIVARCDGQPIRWPEPTHGPGRLPLRTAAECIDWSLPCPSIFERKRPLAEKTLWRIAQGIRRFVLQNPRPFLVRMAHGEVAPDGVTRRRGHGAQDLEAPLPTVTGSGGGAGFAVAVPSLVEMTHENRPASVEAPLGTVTTQGNRFNLVVPIVAGVGGRSGQSPATPGDAPVGTITGKNDRVFVAPSLIKVNHGKREARGEAADEPLTTVTATQRGHALVAPTLMQMGHGERDGQAARVPGLDKPVGTVTAGGRHHALVSAFLAQHFGGMVGKDPGASPMPTITARDHHSLAAATLLRFNHDDHGVPLEAPLPTITAGTTHVAEVRAFLTAFYGQDRGAGKGQDLRDPMRTLTAKHRLGLVTIEGTDYQIVDIGIRMLEPHELARAQFGRFADRIDLSAARTKSKKVHLIGNSVCPEVAEAIVAANRPHGAATHRGGSLAGSAAAGDPVSWGLVVCGTCHREVHQDGARQHGPGCRCAANDSGWCPAGWRHCEDKTPCCDGAGIVYPKTREEIVGRFCGIDEIVLTQRPLWDDVDPKALPPLPDDEEVGDETCEHGVGFDEDCEGCEDEMDDDGSFPPEDEA